MVLPSCVKQPPQIRIRNESNKKEVAITNIADVSSFFTQILKLDSTLYSRGRVLTFDAVDVEGNSLNGILSTDDGRVLTVTFDSSKYGEQSGHVKLSPEAMDSINVISK